MIKTHQDDNIMKEHNISIKSLAVKSLAHIKQVCKWYSSGLEIQIKFFWMEREFINDIIKILY